MSLTAIIDSINVNSEAGGIVVEGEADFGEAIYTEPGEKKAMSGAHTTDADRQPRIAILHLRFEGTSEATRDTLYDLVKTALEDTSSTTGTLEYNRGAWASNRYLKFYHGVSTIETTETVAGHFNFVRRATVTLHCKPFSLGTAFSPPKNLVPDALMSASNAGDGVPNGFLLYGSGTTPTYSMTQDADGWTKIQVTAGAAGRFIGLQSATTFAIVAGNIISSRLEFKCAAATGGCSYSAGVYESAGAGLVKWSQLNGRTAEAATATEAISENHTVSASTTSGILSITIDMTADGTATLYVRKAMVVVAAALTKGADGGTMFYGSTLTETPGTLTIENVAGTAPALARIQIEAAGVGSEAYYMNCMIGRRLKTTTGLVKFVDDGIDTASVTETADAACHGGKTILVNLAVVTKYEGGITFPTVPPGTYIPVIKTKTSAATPTGDGVWLHIYSGISTFVNSGHDTETVYFQNDANYQILSYKPVSIPDVLRVDGAPVADVSITPNYSGAVSGTWGIDYVALIPVDAEYAFVNNLPGFISDNITSQPAFYFSGAGSLAYPPPVAALEVSNAQKGSPLCIPTKAELAVLCYDALLADTANQIYGASISMTITPRYLV